MNLKDLNKKPATSEEVSLKDLVLISRHFFSYLLSKWVLIVCFGLIGGLLGFAYSYIKQPIYSAVTTFVLEEGDKGGGIGQYAGLASMAGIELGGGGGGIFQGDNILELYKSRKMIQKTLLSEVQYNGKKCLLIDRYIHFNKLGEEWVNISKKQDNKFGVNHPDSKTDFIRLKDSVLGVIVADISKRYLSVSKPDKKLSIIKAEIRAKDEFFAKAFNDQIVKNVNDFYVQTKMKKSLENISILQQKTDSVRAVMNGAIYTAAAVSDATPNLNPTRQVQRVAPMQKSQFNAETNRVILAELVKNLEMSKMAMRKEMPLIQVIDQPVFPLSKEKMSKLEGIAVGGFTGGFLIVLILLIIRVLKSIMA